MDKIKYFPFFWSGFMFATSQQWERNAEAWLSEVGVLNDCRKLMLLRDSGTAGIDFWITLEEEDYDDDY